MANRKNKGKNSAEQPPTPISPAATAGLPKFTPQQIEVAQAQAAQRLRVEHATLKVTFADTAVALAIANQERDQLIQRVQASQKIIEQLSVELEALKQAAADDFAKRVPQPEDPDESAEAQAQPEEA